MVPFGVRRLEENGGSCQRRLSAHRSAKAGRVWLLLRKSGAGQDEVPSTDQVTAEVCGAVTRPISLHRGLFRVIARLGALASLKQSLSQANASIL